MRRIIGVSLAALSTAAVSTFPLLVSTHAQAAIAPLEAAYGALKTTTTNYGGPATATLVIGGKTYKFKNGTCMSIKAAGTTVDVTLGTVVQGKGGGFTKGNDKKPYFSIDMSPSPTPDIVNSVFSGGKDLADGGEITVTGSVVKSGSSKGTFSGGDAPDTFTGSWNCHGKFLKH